MRRADLQLDEGRIAIKTLKRRSKALVREVPIPDALVQEFAMVHFHELHDFEGWVFSDDDTPPPRIACYRWVKYVMGLASIHGPQACPKGLRHGYGVHATKQGVQLHMLQKWMGHADMKTTAIYATALGRDEAEIAARIWA